jgi:Holliday junction DNA helicase RuvA
MYAFISGKIVHRSPTVVVLENNGIGYEIHISLHTYGSIQSEDTCKLYTHFHVKEDGQALYGFYMEDEKDLFEKLISVSGIGPNLARMVLSSYPPEEIKEAILSEDEVKIKSIKGIGPKSAKRLILELKDKVTAESVKGAADVPIANNTLKEEALSALIMLGFSKSQAEKGMAKTLRQDQSITSVEALIKESLKNL